MSDIDWHEIATATRERRFQDIPDEIWDQIADLIEKKKRGKGRPPDPMFEVPFGGGFCKEEERVLACGMTQDERTKWIGRRFNELRVQGVRSIVAQKKIAKELNCSVKVVEAALSKYRAKQVFIKNAQQRNDCFREEMAKYDWSSDHPKSKFSFNCETFEIPVNLFDQFYDMIDNYKERTKL